MEAAVQTLSIYYRKGTLRKYKLFQSLNSLKRIKMNTKRSSKCKCITPELVMASCSHSKTSSRSVVKFYNSIPDYEDLNHLNEIEFYSRLGTLRETYSRLKYGSDTTLSSEVSKSDESFETVKEFKVKTKDKREPAQESEVDKENQVAEDTFENVVKEQGFTVTSSTKQSRRTKSASPSRRCSLKTSSKTSLGPKCKSLSRYESSMIELPAKSKGKKKRAGYIPLTSRIPIYDQIMEDQKQRSQIRKLESAIELQSKMKLFHFSTKSRSRCSSVQSAVSGDLFIKKEKPSKSCPVKKANSSYFHSKKWEEDYFRRVNRMISAEDLLKLSTPSPTGKKEAARPKSNGSCKFCSRKRGRKKTILKQKDQNKDRPSTATEQTNAGNLDTKATTPDSSENLANDTALPIYPVARPNLAAKLRAEVARKRTQQISEINQPKHPSHFDWGVRKTPAWKSLSYNETNDEDISFRLATRRAEQCLRNREYALNMELMRDRVRAAPLLLEGTTYWSQRVGKASHNCGKEARGSAGKSEKKRIKSAGSGCFETKFVKKASRSANCSIVQKNTDSDDLESEDRAYL